jgi:hypothetical protein
MNNMTCRLIVYMELAKECTRTKSLGNITIRLRQWRPWIE